MYTLKIDMALLIKERQQTIDDVVENVRLFTGLTYPENTLEAIAEALGVKIFISDFEEPNINGVIKYKNDEGKEEPIIFINKKYSPEKRTFTLAHELGHFMLHKGDEKYRRDRFDYTDDSEASLQETEANYFAATLLVPKNKLQDVLKLTGGGNLDSVAEYFGVSVPVIENRIAWIKKNGAE